MSRCAPVRRSFSDERGPGTFHSLGTLPKRKSDTPSRKYPVFHIPLDDEDEHQSPSLDEHTTPPTVPFPSSTSPPSPSSSTPRPQLSRGDSAPISLSSGKPLKSSLKSSSSSPAVLTHPHMHLRARSEPSTPAVTPKNVHFPEKDYALATVRVFNCKARPAALSNPGNGDETETEGEDTPPLRFPFPPLVTYEIDPTKSSSVPSKFDPHANLLLESLSLSSSFFTASPTAKPLLTGSVLVRNLTFEKHVGIRFTLDDWQIVSEVSAHYALSLPSLPSHICPSLSASTAGDSSPKSGSRWDRFTFTIRLEDYEHSLSTRTMWLAAHYRVKSTYPECGTGGEWWDNNAGSNYRVGFRPAVVTAAPPKSRPRRETVSVPIASPRNQPQPPTTCKEHALGLMIPSISNNMEIHPVNGTDRHSVSLRVGKLHLCNYSPPVVHPASSISFPSMGSPPSLPPSSITNLELLSPATLRPSSHDDSASPASSTLSTPSPSPMMAPRLIIGGHPATYANSSSEKEDVSTRSLKPGHITNWDWSPKQSARHSADLGPVSDTVSPSRKAVTEDPLYNAFVTQWCFAQESSLNHNSYGPGEIMA